MMPDPTQALTRLVQMLARTQPTEAACDEVFSLLDLFVECVLRGEDVAALMPQVQQHLEMCPDCWEEYEALLRLTQAAGWPRLRNEKEQELE